MRAAEKTEYTARGRCAQNRTLCGSYTGNGAVGRIVLQARPVQPHKKGTRRILGLC